jgi:hypothetical protein
MPKIGLKTVESRCVGGALAMEWAGFGEEGVVESGSVDVDFGDDVFNSSIPRTTVVLHTQDLENFACITGMISALSRDGGEVFFWWRSCVLCLILAALLQDPLQVFAQFVDGVIYETLQSTTAAAESHQ